MSADDIPIAPSEEEKRRRFLAHAARVTMGLDDLDRSKSHFKQEMEKLEELVGNLGTAGASMPPARIRLEQANFLLSALRQSKRNTGANADRLMKISTKLGDFLEADRTPGPTGSRVQRKPISRFPRRAIDRALRTLPLAERERYFDEFLSELEEIAQSSRSRRAQLRYTIRLLWRVPVLWFALREPDAKANRVRR
ncbi:hypothetical protein [Amycolatopsis minnesotensis]